MNVEQILELMDQMVLPASTADIYKRATSLGLVKGINPARERADMSSYLARARKKDAVNSFHDDAGVLLWDIKKLNPKTVIIRAARPETEAVMDEILRINKNPTANAILADLFDELSSGLMNAAKKLRRMP